MKAYIYTGGKVHTDLVNMCPDDNDIVIAADSGYLTAVKMGVKVDILLGDFDSLGIENLPDNCEIVSFPPEKDDTDTQLAVAKALEKGADEIIIIGGLSGRLDHTLSVLAILEYLSEKGTRAIVTDGQNRVRYLSNSALTLERSSYKYFSLLAISEGVSGVDITGCKYELHNAEISRKNQFAVSNEITAQAAVISVKKGKIFVVDSIDV